MSKKRISITDFKVFKPIEIAWGHMDSFNHVNNVIYFRFLETARIDLFEKMGINSEWEGMEVGPILAETSCKFIRPLVYPDTIQVGTIISEINEFGFEIQHGIFSDKIGIAATGIAKVVMYDYTRGVKSLLSEPLKNKLSLLI